MYNDICTCVPYDNVNSEEMATTFSLLEEGQCD